MSPSYRNPTLLEIQKAFKWPDEFSPIFKELSQGTPNDNDLFFLIYIGCKFLQKPCLLKDGKILASIFQYKDQKMRHDLTDLAFDLTEKQIKIYEKFSTPSFLQLPALIFCSGSQTDEDPAIYHALLSGKKEFKDGLLQKVLLDSLYLLIIKNRFDTRESIHLLRNALSKNIKTNLFCIQGILYCDGKDILRKEAQNENLNLDVAYQNAFNQSIPFKPVKNFAEKYERTFGTCALPSAPLIYAGKLRQLSRDDQEKGLLCLGGYIHSVLENDYQGIRYKGSKHLEKIFTKQSSLRSNWPKEVEVPLEDYIKSTTSKIIFNPQTFLLEKILREGHLPKGKYADLFQFLGTKEDKAAEEILVGLNKKIMEIADADKKRIVQAKATKDALTIIKDSKDKSLGQKLKSLKDAGKKIMGLPGITEGLETIEKLIQANRKQQKIEDPGQIKIVEVISSQFTQAGEEALSHLTLKQEIRQERQQIQLQKDLIDLYRSKPSQQLNLLGKIQKNLNPLEEFYNDVKGIMESLTKHKESTEEYTLVNTDRFDLMLLSGTQVQGSCQRIDGSPSLNKCLLAYLVDGKNRLIAIKDKKGNIVARSIFRLLWDKTKDRPALMQERIYSNVLDSSMTDALDKFAVDQAKSLGVSLYKANETGSAQLESYGGPAPWEYVDSAEGVMPNSIFTITGATEVYIHPSS